MSLLARLPRPVAWIGGFLIAAGAAGVLAAWLGLIPIAASSGHWKITAWVLHWTMRNSVELRSWGTSPPEGLSLDDPALVLRGAGHYAAACVPCHGAPGKAPSVLAAHMTPAPPYLPETAATWDETELFWIVRHGVKFTAMPAWPAMERKDEVWSMVAFLRRLPGMSPPEYASLTATEPAAAGRLRALTDPVGDLVADSCARCHGVDGLGRGKGAFPKLAGQKPAYLRASLDAFALGRRHSGFMQPVAAALTEAQRQALADYYAALPPGPPEPPEGDSSLGRSIAERGVPDRGIGACRHCHGPGTGEKAALYPLLAGQYADYLELQLDAFRQEVRGGTAFAPVMRGAAHRLTEDEAAAVAAFYAALAPE